MSSTLKPPASNGQAIDWQALIDAAKWVRRHAHAPYSEFQVGAALLSANGTIIVGCNVENAAYPAGICAERTAIASMVAAGEREPIALAIVTEGDEPAAPCGMCRQVLAEFALDLPIVLVGEGATEVRESTSLAELLPRAFRGDALEAVRR